MEGIRVVLADTYPIGIAGKRILALVHQLFHNLAPEASLIEMHVSLEPELALAPYEASHLVTPQILVLRDEANSYPVVPLTRATTLSPVRLPDVFRGVALLNYTLSRSYYSETYALE